MDDGISGTEFANRPGYMRLLNSLKPRPSFAALIVSELSRLGRAQIAPAQLPAYQNARTDAGRAPKTINGELSVLRQVLKRAKLWYRFNDDYTTLRNRKPPVGRALTAEEQSRLFEMARTNPAWLFACVVATLSFYCGLRACEIKALRWQDIELGNRLLHVRRSKTPAGWRAPTLNATCLSVLQELHDTSAKLGFTQSTHFVFPWHGRNKQLDPRGR